METQREHITLSDAGGVILAPSWAAIASLHKHLAATMAAVAAVHKDGRHGTGFAYTSWDEAAAAISTAMAANGLAFTATITDSATANNQTTVAMDMTICDVESGAMKVLHWQASAMTTTAATTICVKHALSKTLLISAEHDDNPPPAEQRRSTGQTPRPQPAPPAVDPATGVLANAVPSTIQPIPPAAAKPGLKWQWMINETRAKGWTAHDLSAWLIKTYNIAQPALLNGQTDAACMALYAVLRAAELEAARTLPAG